MRVSISNIAWDARHDASMASLLAEHSVDAIDVALSRYFADPAQASPAEVARVRSFWLSHGIEIVALQSLLFGVTGANLFGDDSAQRALLDRLTAAAGVAADLGAGPLVFGSPRNRDAAGWDSGRATAHAVDFFRRVGDKMAACAVVLCLEPAAKSYGCNFMTSTHEAAAVVRATDHPAIRLQLDTGAVTLNHESMDDVLSAHGLLIGHIHASEPGLAVLGEGGTDHARIGASIAAAFPRRTVTIEMLTPADQTPEHAATAALRIARKCYAAGT